MDKTLNDFLNQTDEIYNSYNYKEGLDEIKNNIKLLQMTLQRMIIIHNKINMNYRRSHLFINRENPDIIPNKDEWKEFKKKEKNIEVVPNVKIGAKIIDSIHELPNYNMFYVKDINSFAIQINGITFIGNIGNITKKKLQIDCKNKKCNTINCPYYHGGIRNFSTGCWLYSNIINKKTKYMRHIGNRLTLFQDIERIKYSNEKNNEVSLFNSQVIHDILVALALNQNL